MFSIALRSITIARVSSTRVVPMACCSRYFSIGDTLGKKEKVEEDRYMRELEKKYIEKKKAEMVEKMHADDEKKFAEQIAPAMAEAEVLLSKAGDSVSHDSLEALAKWKVGL